MNEQEFAELSAAAALHALSPDDERRFRTALAVHPEWRRIARADAEAAAALALPVPPVTPPTDIRSALLSAIPDAPQGDRETASAPPAPTPAAETRDRTDDGGRDAASRPHSSAALPQDTPAGDPQPAPRERRRGLRNLFALAACLVLLVGIGMGATALSSYLNRPADVVALEQIEASGDAQQAEVPVAAGGSATAHWSASLGRAVLVTEGIAAPADGQTYELWFVRGDTAVSAGTFSVDDGKATAELRGEMKAGDAIAVTVEQSGGSPTGVPTSDPVIVIPTA
ncbi:anti-sigma factor [Microbacterium sp. OVT16B]|uniref:anti-sigma factor n=1 Tax=Microbacterium sp. OVT16B TaxID=2862682 RepID=UPI001CBE4E76|nr:anti-sigma factor [Microbacterium sp. OVT16B]